MSIRLYFVVNANHFSLGDINFFKQYHQAMQPICVALDIIQGENNDDMGILFPTIAMTMKKLRNLNENESLAMVQPPQEIIAGIENRFGKFNDFDLPACKCFSSAV